MFGKVIGAVIGKKMAGPNSGLKGMMLGAAAPMVARRMFGPLGLAIGGGYFAKKMYDRRKARRSGVDGPAFLLTLYP